eukprot:2912305-Ditylum_brightwellii.AAC.1
MDWSEDQQLDYYVEGDNIIADDIQYEDKFEVRFGDVSIMLVSCTNYYNGHLIKYELFENEKEITVSAISKVWDNSLYLSKAS